LSKHIYSTDVVTKNRERTIQNPRSTKMNEFKFVVSLRTANIVAKKLAAHYPESNPYFLKPNNSYLSFYLVEALIVCIAFVCLFSFPPNQDALGSAEVVASDQYAPSECIFF